MLDAWSEDCYLLVDEFGEVGTWDCFSFLHYAHDIGLNDDCIISFGKGFYFLYVLFLRCDKFVRSFVLIIKLIGLVHLVDR